jgi:hypothetical protein
MTIPSLDQLSTNEIECLNFKTRETTEPFNQNSIMVQNKMKELNQSTVAHPHKSPNEIELVS